MIPETLVRGGAPVLPLIVTLCHTGKSIPGYAIIEALEMNIYGEMIEMSKVAQLGVDALKVKSNQMVFSIPSEEDGVDEILYVDSANDTYFSTQPVNLGGAWAGLIDGDELLESIDLCNNMNTISVGV